MSKPNIQYGIFITDTLTYKDERGNDIILFATSIDNQLRMRRYVYGYLLEYTWKSIYVDINGAVDGYSYDWRLPDEMRNKIFSIRDRKVQVREIVDFTDYYNDPDDID